MHSPLLVFDSGVGGLSVMHHIDAILPQAPLLYVADNGAFPYGNKTEGEIIARTCHILPRLVQEYDPCAIIIACNTASTVALADLRARLDRPIVGTVPAIKPAARLSQTGVIGILGTVATVRQPYVDHLIQEFAAHCRVLRHGSTALVTAAEQKIAGFPPAPALCRRELDALFTQEGGEDIDVIILACTHFPLIAAELQQATMDAGRQVHFLDSGAAIAQRTADLLQNQKWPAQRPDRHFLWTAPVDETSTSAQAIRREFTHVDVMQGAYDPGKG